MTERISPQMRARLEALSDRNVGRRMVWTKEMDAILLLGWTKKRHEDIAKIIGLNVTTCRRRFEELARRQA